MLSAHWGKQQTAATTEKQKQQEPMKNIYNELVYIAEFSKSTEHVKKKIKKLCCILREKNVVNKI